MKTTSRGALLTLAAVSALLTLAAAELALRRILPRDSRYAIFPPGTRLTLHPDSNYLPGIGSRTKHFSISSDGIRGRPADRHRAEYRILTIGGSSTETLYQDDEETWAARLERGLDSMEGRPVWVGNAGRSGMNSRDHVVQLRYLGPQLPPLDAVVILAGVNDLGTATSQADAYRRPPPLGDPAAELQQILHAFAVVPLERRLAGPPRAPWYRRLTLYDALRHARLAVNTWRQRALRQDESGANVERWRQFRRRATVWRDTLPDLSAPLEEYRANLTALAVLARERHIRLLLATQPMLWRTDLQPAEERRLWVGGLGAYTLHGSTTYFTTRALSGGIDRYNAVMRSVCATEQVECVDLAADIPHDTTMFYDDVHFTDAGARAVGDALVAHFRALR